MSLGVDYSLKHLFKCQFGNYNSFAYLSIFVSIWYQNMTAAFSSVLAIMDIKLMVLFDFQEDSILSLTLT